MAPNGAVDSAQLLANMRSVIAMHRNLEPVVTAGRLRELRSIVESQLAWATERLDAFAELQPEASSYALMLRSIGTELERVGQLSPGVGLGAVFPGGDDPASRIEAAIGGIETLSRSLEDRLLGG